MQSRLRDDQHAASACLTRFTQMHAQVFVSSRILRCASNFDLSQKETKVKIKLFIAGLAIAGLVVSSAVAAPPDGKGKPDNPGAAGKAHKPATTGPNCKPKITVVLRGTFTSATTTSLVMDVVGANRWGRAWKTAGTATVTLDDHTMVRGNGMKTVSDLVARMKDGDRVLVQSRVCKGDLKEATAMPTLTASKVVGHPAKAEVPDD
jgi:hypothetical protein